MSLPISEAIEVDTGVVEVNGVTHFSGARILNAVRTAAESARRTGRTLDLTPDNVVAVLSQITTDAYGAARTRSAA